MDSKDTMFQTALEALKEGNRARARDLLTRLLKTDSNNIDYWLWMSACVETEKERFFCLKEASRIDPDNINVRNGLTMLGEIPLDDNSVISYKSQRRYIESAQSGSVSLLDKVMLSPPWVQFSLIGAGVVLVAFLLFIGFQGVKKLPFYPQKPTPITLNLNMIFTQTPTPTGSEPTQIFSESTPLSSALNATYTPTPVYINTPHPQTEDFRNGMRAFSEGEYENAIRFFEEVLKNEPEAADIYYYIGESYHFMGDDSNAYNYYGQALDVEPYFAPAYVGRAVSRLGIDANEVKASKADIKTAIEIDPNFVDAYVQLAIIILDELDGRTALEYLDLALELSPDSPVIHYQRAQAYLLLNDFEEALQEALTSHEFDLTFVPVYRQIGEIYFLLEDPQSAADYLAAYVVYFPEDAQAWAWLGIGYYEGDEMELALEAVDEAIKLAPNTFDAVLQRGILYAEDDRLALAESDLQKALTLQPRSFKTNLYLGQVYFLEDQYYQAYAKLSYAAGLEISDEEMVQVLYWRAQVLEGLSELKTAARDWQTLLDMPEEMVPQSWRRQAQNRLNELITPTRTPEGYVSSSTPFRTSTPTAVTPSATPTPSPTPAN